MHALLVTQDERVIAEFQKIAAVTQTPLVIAKVPNSTDISNAYRVFVTPDCAEVSIIHNDIVLVVVGATGPETWRNAAKLSATHIAVIPDSREWLVEHLCAPITKRGFVVGIMPGAGGAGASLLSCGLAFHARQFFKEVALVDLDGTSAGLDILFGIETKSGTRWQSLETLSGTISGSDILRGLPTRDGISLLTHDESDKAVDETLASTIIEQLRSCSDLVIIDLPRFGMENTSLKVLEQCDVILMMTPSTVRGSASTKKAITNVLKYVSNVELVVRSFPGTNLDALKIAQSLDVPLAGVINSDPRIAEQIEQGFGISGIHLGGFTRSMNALAQRLVQTYEIQNAA